MILDLSEDIIKNHIIPHLGWSDIFNVVLVAKKAHNWPNMAKDVLTFPLDDIYSVNRKILESMKNIVVMDENVTNKQLEWFKNVSEIALWTNENITDVGLRHLNAKRISIQECNGFTDEGMYYLQNATYILSINNGRYTTRYNP
jgi:DNA modification methylase